MRVLITRRGTPLDTETRLPIETRLKSRLDPFTHDLDWLILHLDDRTAAEEAVDARTWLVLFSRSVGVLIVEGSEDNVERLVDSAVTRLQYKPRRVRKFPPEFSEN